MRTFSEGNGTHLRAANKGDVCCLLCVSSALLLTLSMFTRCLHPPSRAHTKPRRAFVTAIRLTLTFVFASPLWSLGSTLHLCACTIAHNQPHTRHSVSHLCACTIAHNHTPGIQYLTFALAQSHTTNHTPGIQSLTSVLAQSHTTTHQAFSISPLRLHNRTQPTTHQAFSLSHLCLHNRTQPTTHQAFSLSFLWQSRGSTSQGTSEREEQTKEISTLRSTTDLSRRAPSDGPWLSSSAPPALPSSESSRRTSDSDEV
jgi:hypothetical protein